MANEKEKTVVEEDDEILTLTYDDGSSEEFYCLGDLDYEGKWYTFLAPMAEDEDSEEKELIIYESAADEEGNEMFLPVEDDDLLNKLVEMFDKEVGNI